MDAGAKDDNIKKKKLSIETLREVDNPDGVFIILETNFEVPKL